MIHIAIDATERDIKVTREPPLWSASRHPVSAS
jgi:hypothetical protein